MEDRHVKWNSLVKIGVSGSRYFEERDLVCRYLEEYIRKKYRGVENICIITGGAFGVDDFVQRMCMRLGIPNLIINARWLELDKIAGPHRNKHIVQMSDEMFAFPAKLKSRSKGTRSFIRYARLTNKPLTVVMAKELRYKYKRATPKYKLPSTAKKKVVRGIRQAIKDVGGIRGLKNIFDMDMEDWSQ